MGSSGSASTAAEDLRQWTRRPTILPSYHPTILPSYHPTSLPSYEPTILRAYHPTSLPSYEPTILRVAAKRNHARGPVDSTHLKSLLARPKERGRGVRTVVCRPGVSVRAVCVRLSVLCLSVCLPSVCLS